MASSSTTNNHSLAARRVRVAAIGLAVGAAAAVAALVLTGNSGTGTVAVATNTASSASTASSGSTAPSAKAAPPASTNSPASTPPAPPASTSVAKPASSQAPAPASAACSLPDRSGAAGTVPLYQVCSSQGAPHFDTPQAAMTYLASAWNAGNTRQIDYVTDPAGRDQLNSMASLLVNLRFKSCTANPAGDYTCYLMHDIVPSTSPTTYPNPMNYPPGEAVFTVAPASGPGWYLTQVVHCG